MSQREVQKRPPIRRHVHRARDHRDRRDHRDHHARQTFHPL